MDHELNSLQQYIEEAQARLANRCRLRELNLHENIDYTNVDLDKLDRLDSSIKKNSALVKRLKVFSESQKGQILDEIDKLNLTKFISEIAASLIEAKLKLSDIPSMVEICTKLNRSYKEFSRQLLDQYVKYFPSLKRKLNDNSSVFVQSISNHLGQSGGGGSSSSGSGPTSSSQACLIKVAGRVSNNETIPSISPSKLRVDLRLLAELIVTGILPLKEGFPLLMNLLYYLMLHDKNIHQNANAILTFCRGCGDDFMGLMPKHIEELALKHKRDLPKGDYINAKRQALIRSCMHEYFQALSKHVQGLHDSLDQLVAKNDKVCKIKGELSKESRDLVEAKRLEFSKVNSILVQLSELLGETAPTFYDPLTTVEGRDLGTIDVTTAPSVDESADNESSMWDDEGTRSFYEDLLDLRTLFPDLQKKARVLKKTDNQPPKDYETPAPDQSARDGDSPQFPEPDKESNEARDKSNVSSSSSESLDGIDSTPTSCLQMAKSVADRKQPEQYFTKLSECVNRDMIDSSAIDFIRFFNTKVGRKKLVRTLYNVHRTRLDLLPFFARLTATIYPYVPSVGNELASLLRQEFRNLFRKKDQINIESKVKNVRFIAELVKFNLSPKQDALNCLKCLLSDFTHHHIEMTCNLLEVCGRLLYKSPESHHQLRLILEQMMRKKMLLSVDSKYVTMIENAYYFTNPPKVTKRVVEEPPVHLYIKYLLYDFLNRSTIDKVLKKIKLTDWNDKSLAKFVINCMIEAYNLKFYNIRYLAALLSALNEDHQWISIAVVDGVIEDILLMMEINDIHFNQRRIPMVRYFGELYNYRLSDSSLVFKILYSFITYGVYYPDPSQNLTQMHLSHLDPPDNLFRLKLICDLLDTCGHYMNSSMEKKKLDCYLLFFQRYYWCKKHIYLLHPYCMVKSGNQFPASTEYLYNDTIKNLRPRFKMVASYAEAIQASQTIIDSLQREQAC